jgi:hypothetical protein
MKGDADKKVSYVNPERLLILLNNSLHQGHEKIRGEGIL